MSSADSDARTRNLKPSDRREQDTNLADVFSTVVGAAIGSVCLLLFNLQPVSATGALFQQVLHWGPSQCGHTDILCKNQRFILIFRFISALLALMVGTQIGFFNAKNNVGNRIWFCFFPPYIGGESGIGSLLGLWGGEALYRQHNRDPEIGPILSKTGIPCLVEADVPIVSLRPHSSLEMKIVRQYLKSRGLQTSEPVEHEDCATRPVPAAKIRGIIRYGELEFTALTKCDTWRKRLV